jgi:hypothetical protein
VTIFQDIRQINRQDKMFLVRYALAIAIEIAVAVWLLSVARDEYAWAAWIAYLILISAALATFIGLLWCWLWLAERGLGWYFAAILAVVSAWILTSGAKLSWDAIVSLGLHAH